MPTPGVQSLRSASQKHQLTATWTLKIWSKKLKCILALRWGCDARYCDLSKTKDWISDRRLLLRMISSARILSGTLPILKDCLSITAEWNVTWWNNCSQSSTMKPETPYRRNHALLPRLGKTAEMKRFASRIHGKRNIFSRTETINCVTLYSARDPKCQISPHSNLTLTIVNWIAALNCRQRHVSSSRPNIRINLVNVD